MRFKPKKDFREAARRKIIKESKKRVNAKINIGSERKVIFINENSSYFKFRSFIVGRIVKIVRDPDLGSNSWVCEFIRETDSLNLNRAAGWSDNKKQYLFDGVKFKK